MWQTGVNGGKQGKTFLMKSDIILLMKTKINKLEAAAGVIGNHNAANVKFTLQMSGRSTKPGRGTGILKKSNAINNKVKVNLGLKTSCFKTRSSCSVISGKSTAFPVSDREKLRYSRGLLKSCLKKPVPYRENVRSYLENLSLCHGNPKLCNKNVMPCRANPGTIPGILSRFPEFPGQNREKLTVSLRILTANPGNVISIRELLDCILKNVWMCLELSGPCHGKAGMNPAIPGICLGNPVMGHDFPGTCHEIFRTDRGFPGTCREIFNTFPGILRTCSENLSAGNEKLEAWRAKLCRGREIPGLCSEIPGTGREFFNTWPENFGSGRGPPDICANNF